MPQTGEIRDELRKELLRNLDRIVGHDGLKNFDPALTNYGHWEHLTKVMERRTKHAKNYWLLIHDKWVGDVLHTFIIVLDGMPDKFIGTQVWQVNESRGKVDCRWVLPIDRPATNVDLVDPSGKILESAKGAPLH